MIRNVRKPLLFIGVPILLIGIAVLLFYLITGGYNVRPNLSSKVVGSHNMKLDRIPPRDFNDIVDYTELAVTATVLDDGTALRYNMIDNEELAAAEKAKGLDTYANATLSKLKIDTVIAGKKPDSDIITLFQFGSPGKADVQTKVKKGDTILIMLRKYIGADYYTAVEMEDSIFYISKDKKVTSMSDKKLCARYDGLPLDRLIGDIKQTDYYKSTLTKG